MTFTVDIPGAFESFFTGTGAIQQAGTPGYSYSDNPDMERGAIELRRAWETSTRLRRGRGHTDRVELSSVEAAIVLAEYAEVCLSSNFGGDREWSEINAARTVLARIEKATDGRVTFDGWNVYLDGERVPFS